MIFIKGFGDVVFKEIENYRLFDIIEDFFFL
jgi:hypothetical protein